MTVTIQVRGFNAVANHFAAAGAAINPLAAILVGAVTSEGARIARELELPHFDTGDTFFSIRAGERGSGAADVSIGEGGAVSGYFGSDDTGSPQNYLLEFGFVHKDTGAFIQYPFIIPAAMAVKPLFEQQMVNIVQMLSGGRVVSGGIGGKALTQASGSLRGSLYSAAKFLGDLQVFGIGGLGGIRSALYLSARGLGDMNSIMRGAIGTRLTHRVTGRFTGLGLSASASAILSGPGGSYTSTANRIYNRFAGAQTGSALRGIED